ncbi:MAG TPA: hypothetical protein VHT48_06805 [Methylocella sp.]|nr:hypothetical protein [Methylocella sp.]
MPREIFAVGPENLPLFTARLKPHRASYARNFHVVMPFVRLEREQDGRFGSQPMALVSRGEDKTNFAADLFWALAEARRGHRWALPLPASLSARSGKNRPPLGG